MLKRGIAIGALGAILVAVVALYCIVRFGAVPANADDRPPQLERWAARMSLHATLARSAPRGDAPIALTDENLIAGIKLYGQNCAVCHGDASGKASNVAKGLYQKPPQLAKDGVEDDPAGVVWWKVAHGIRWTGMPAFGKTLNQTQLWELTVFLRHMDHLPSKPDKVWRAVKA